MMPIYADVAEFPTGSTPSGGVSADVPAASETPADALIERVEELIQAGKVPLVWGSPLVLATPTSLAIQQLAVQAEALEKAVREIARVVQKLSDEG